MRLAVLGLSLLFVSTGAGVATAQTPSVPVEWIGPNGIGIPAAPVYDSVPVPGPYVAPNYLGCATTYNPTTGDLSVRWACQGEILCPTCDLMWLFVVPCNGPMEPNILSTPLVTVFPPQSNGRFVSTVPSAPALSGTCWRVVWICFEELEPPPWGTESTGTFRGLNCDCFCFP